MRKPLFALICMVGLFMCVYGLMVALGRLESSVQVNHHNLPDRKYSENVLKRNKVEYRTSGFIDSIVWHDGEIVIKPLNDNIGIFWHGDLIAEDCLECMPNGTDWEVSYAIGNTTEKWNIEK